MPEVCIRLLSRNTSQIGTRRGKRRHLISAKVVAGRWRAAPTTRMTPPCVRASQRLFTLPIDPASAKLERVVVCQWSKQHSWWWGEDEERGVCKDISRRAQLAMILRPERQSYGGDSSRRKNAWGVLATVEVGFAGSLCFEIRTPRVPGIGRPGCCPADLWFKSVTRDGVWTSPR